MLLWWAVDRHQQQLPSMVGSSQTIAYISDVGAFQLKPMFISMSVVVVVFLDIGIIAERWLRHTGRLAPNTSWTQKILSMFAILFALIGAAGLILLSIFDTYRHNKLHNIFLLLFIGGYIISAIFLCAEYQRLGIHYRHHRILAISFWMKLAFIIIEVVLAIVFASTSFTEHYNIAAGFEWTIAFIYTFWVLSFLIDLLPSVRTKNHIPQGHKDIMAEQGAAPFSQQSTRNHSREQNLTDDSAGPNRMGEKVVEEPAQRRGKMARLFSNLY